MRARQWANTLACAGALLATSAFALADERPELLLLIVPAVIGGFLAGRGMVKSGGRAATDIAMSDRGAAWALPKLVVNLMVLGAILHACLRIMGGVSNDPIVSVLGQFLVSIQLIKLFDRRTSRDEAQTISLGVFVVIATILTSNSLVVAFLIVLQLPIVTMAAMLWQIRDGQRWADEGEAQEARRPEPLATTPADRDAGRDLIGVGALAVVASLLVAGVVFVVMPRVGDAGVLGQFGVSRQSQTGFTDSVRLGQAGLLSESRTPVLELTVTDAVGRDAGADGRIYYLRGAVNTVYNPDDHTWKNSSALNKHNTVLEGGDVRPLVRRGTPVSGTLTARIVHLSGVSSDQRGNVLFTVWQPVSIRTDTRVQVAYLDTQAVMQALSKPVGARLAYDVAFMENPGASWGAPVEELGFQSGPVRDLAERVLREAGLPERPDPEDSSQVRSAASALRDYVRDRNEYTLEMIAPRSGQDPIEMFLFETRRGHCEYFASALVALCQSVGIHARVVIGYLATDYNASAGQYIIHQSNAHAWAEVHLAGGRWQTFEPTPAADIARLHQTPNAMFPRIRAWYQALELSWSRIIIGFDRDSSVQTALFGERGRSGTSIGARLDAFGQRLADSLRRQGRPEISGAGVLRWTPALVAVLAAAYVGYRSIRALRTGATSLQRDPELRRLLMQTEFFAQAERLLGRAGLRRPATVSPLAHAAWVESARPGAGAQLSLIADAYYRVRFGRATLGEAELRSAQAACKSLRGLLEPPRHTVVTATPDRTGGTGTGPAAPAPRPQG